MTDSITLTGLVATDPQVVTPRDDLEITTFRLASNQRHFDRSTGAWVDRETNWYTVSMYRQLARNAYRSLHKGDRVVVSGRLRIRRWEKEDRRGTSVEVDADAVGHDLLWGTAVYTRSPREGGTAPSPPPTEAAARGGEGVTATGDHGAGDAGDGAVWTPVTPGGATVPADTPF
ncbi:single-stranded DNA-binding protein [Okibacterium endophyticum]